MTRRALLLDLAARCEAALGMDRELDEAICMAIYPNYDLPLAARVVPSHLGSIFPRYTGSLDAALTLAPKGYALDMFSDDEGCSAMVGSPASGKAATLPLALTAAALKALAAQIGEGE